MKLLPTVTIVGRPNVGKSTLFNRIVGRRQALEFPEAGTTRDRLYAKAEWRGREFLLADTAGLALSPKAQPLFQEIQSQIRIALAEADLIIFVVDGKKGLTYEDKTAANAVLSSGKPVILAVNKIERATKESLAEYYQLGLGEPMVLAAISGVGVGNLLDQVVAKLSEMRLQAGRKVEEKASTVVILGRPNVGKSSILNKLANEPRAIVSDIPGTTRDVVDTEIRYHGKLYRFLDTAGLRRRKQARLGVEALSVLRALKALSQADIALLVLDVKEPVASQDLHIAGFTKAEGKGLIILLNKWDTVSKKLKQKQMESKLIELRRRFAFVPYAPVVFVSAKTGENLEYIFEVIDNVWEARRKKLSEEDLKNFVREINLIGKLPLILKIRQSGTNPPAFEVFVEKPQSLHFSEVRFLDRQLHERFKFVGTPIKINFKRLIK